MIIWVLFNVSCNSRNKRSFVSLRYLFYKSFINHQICNNNHEIHIDTSDKKKNRKKIQRLRYDWQWRRYTFALVTRPLCALTKRRTNWFSSGATTPSIRINLCIILLYREILFTKSLDSSSMREEKKKKKGSVTVFAIFTKRATRQEIFSSRQEIAFVPGERCFQWKGFSLLFFSEWGRPWGLKRW